MQINYHREKDDDILYDDVWELISRSFILKIFFKPVRVWKWHISVDTLATDDQYDENSWHLKNPLWGFTEKFFWLPTMTILVKPSQAEKTTLNQINTMNRCNTCKYWVERKDNNSFRGEDIISPRDPETWDQEEGEEAIAAKWGHNVRFCGHPKLEFSQRPESDGMAVIDGSEFWAALLTGEDFGCILWEGDIAPK